MRKGFTVAALLACLAGCNTTDALIPQVDVGVTNSSGPLTQRDLDQASANADQYAANHPPQQSYQQSANANSNRQQEPAMREAPMRQPMPGYSTEQTLDQQALALQSSGNLSTRLYRQPQQQSDPNLPDTSTQLGAEQQEMPQQPQESAALRGSLDDAQSVQSAPQAQTNEQTVASPAHRANSIRFLPIIGAPVEAVTPLSRGLGRDARASGLTILPSADAAAQHILKGYLSAFEDGDNVNIVYVWDVLDSSGNRVNRLQGQQAAAKQGNDPWASADAAIMEQIARKTIEMYIEWKNSQGG